MEKWVERRLNPVQLISRKTNRRKDGSILKYFNPPEDKCLFNRRLSFTPVNYQRM